MNFANTKVLENLWGGEEGLGPRAQEWLRRGGERSFARRPQPVAAPTLEKSMPKFSRAEREAALARNGTVAQALTTHMRWSAERAACLPPAVRMFMLYVPNAELLVAPWQDPAGQNGQSVTFAINVTRCDVLAVGAGMTANDRLVGVYGTVGLWTRAGPAWHLELRAWCCTAGGLWMAAQPHVEEAGQTAFRLTGERLRAGALPWLNEQERDTGFRRADDLLLREAR